MGRDAGGNVVPIVVTWSVVSGGGTISPTGLFTAGTLPGTFTNTVQATAGLLSGNATVVVLAGPLATITVTPNPDTLAITAAQQFTAVGTDAGGNVVPIVVTWSVVSGGGTISPTGLFTAGTLPGTFTNTVRATDGLTFGNATVVVLAGPLATITVTPNPATLEVNGTQQFTAVGTDASGNVVPITAAWAVINGGGTINGTGFFTAGIIDGTFVNTVRATSGLINGTATVVINEPPPLIPLGTASTYGILAGSFVSCVDLGAAALTVGGDIGLFPAASISGFPTCTLSGALHLADAPATQAQLDLTAAFDSLVALPCGSAIAADLGGQTLTPGVYCAPTSVGLTGTVIIDALGDPNAHFVIKSTTTLTTATAQVTLLNGARARNIYWLVGSSATLGTGSALKGQLIALTSITLNDNATILGRALARKGAVTLGTGNAITLP